MAVLRNVTQNTIHLELATSVDLWDQKKSLGRYGVQHGSYHCAIVHDGERLWNASKSSDFLQKQYTLSNGLHWTRDTLQFAVAFYVVQGGQTILDDQRLLSLVEQAGQLETQTQSDLNLGNFNGEIESLDSILEVSDFLDDINFFKVCLHLILLMAEQQRDFTKSNKSLLGVNKVLEALEERIPQDSTIARWNDFLTSDWLALWIFCVFSVWREIDIGAILRRGKDSRVDSVIYKVQTLFVQEGDYSSAFHFYERYPQHTRSSALDLYLTDTAVAIHHSVEEYLTNLISRYRTELLHVQQQQLQNTVTGSKSTYVPRGIGISTKKKIQDHDEVNFSETKEWTSLRRVLNDLQKLRGFSVIEAMLATEKQGVIKDVLHDVLVTCYFEDDDISALTERLEMGVNSQIKDNIINKLGRLYIDRTDIDSAIELFSKNDTGTLDGQLLLDLISVVHRQKIIINSEIVEKLVWETERYKHPHHRLEGLLLLVDSQAGHVPTHLVNDLVSKCRNTYHKVSDTLGASTLPLLTKVFSAYLPEDDLHQIFDIELDKYHKSNIYVLPELYQVEYLLLSVSESVRTKFHLAVSKLLSDIPKGKSELAIAKRCFNRGLNEKAVFHIQHAVGDDVNKTEYGFTSELCSTLVECQYDELFWVYFEQGVFSIADFEALLKYMTHLNKSDKTSQCTRLLNTLETWLYNEQEQGYEWPTRWADLAQWKFQHRFDTARETFLQSVTSFRRQNYSLMTVDLDMDSACIAEIGLEMGLLDHSIEILLTPLKRLDLVYDNSIGWRQSPDFPDLGRDQAQYFDEKRSKLNQTLLKIKIWIQKQQVDPIVQIVDELDEHEKSNVVLLILQEVFECFEAEERLIFMRVVNESLDRLVRENDVDTLERFVSKLVKIDMFEPIDTAFDHLRSANTLSRYSGMNIVEQLMIKQRFVEVNKWLGLYRSSFQLNEWLSLIQALLVVPKSPQRDEILTDALNAMDTVLKELNAKRRKVPVFCVTILEQLSDCEFNAHAKNLCEQTLKLGIDYPLADETIERFVMVLMDLFDVQQTLNLIHTIQDERYRFDLLYALGAVLESQDNVDDALEIFDQCCELAKQVQDKSQRKTALLKTIDGFLLCGKYPTVFNLLISDSFSTVYSEGAYKLVKEMCESEIEHLESSDEFNQMVDYTVTSIPEIRWRIKARFVQIQSLFEVNRTINIAEYINNLFTMTENSDFWNKVNIQLKMALELRVRNRPEYKMFYTSAIDSLNTYIEKYEDRSLYYQLYRGAIWDSIDKQSVNLVLDLLEDARFSEDVYLCYYALFMIYQERGDTEQSVSMVQKMIAGMNGITDYQAKVLHFLELIKRSGIPSVKDEIHKCLAYGNNSRDFYLDVIPIYQDSIEDLQGLRRTFLYQPCVSKLSMLSIDKFHDFLYKSEQYERLLLIES